jgi:hypothetical protein
MAIHVGVVLKAAQAAAPKVVKVLGPSVGPTVAKTVKKVSGERQLRAAAQDLAWQRGGEVGRIRFRDGVQRWVVIDRNRAPLASFPPFADGSLESLAAELSDVDFDRCMRPPDQLVKQEKREAGEARKLERKDRKAQQARG